MSKEDVETWATGWLSDHGVMAVSPTVVEAMLAATAQAYRRAADELSKEASSCGGPAASGYWGAAGRCEAMAQELEQ